MADGAELGEFAIAAPITIPRRVGSRPLGPRRPVAYDRTLDLDRHLFPDRLDEPADRLDDAVRAPDVPREPPDDGEEDDQCGRTCSYSARGPP